MVMREKMKDGSTRLMSGLTMADIMDAVHPVGDIYMSVQNVNPSTKFGGTWVAWGAGKVPVGVNALEPEFDTVEETGGSKAVTLTAANLPAHSHSMAHTHDMTHNHTNPSGGTPGTASFITRATAASTLGNIGATNQFAGNTGASSAANTGNGPGTAADVNNLQPYITCYMWKRTA